MSTDVRELLNLADYRAAARGRLPASVFAYISGGSGNELAMRDNAAVLARMAIVPRALIDCRHGHTRVDLLGQTFASPLLLAPVAAQGLVHAEGELATARGGGALDVPMVLSCMASQPMETVLAEHGGSCWLQVYWQGSRARTLEVVRRAEAAGFAALVLTVDTPVNGLRLRELRAGFAMPADAAAVNLPAHAARALDVPAGGSRIFQGVMRSAPTWDDVAWLRQQTRLPLVLKGLLAVQDVLRAAALGADGVVLSNHGGRALERAPAAIRMLAAARAAVGDVLPLLIDGGFTTGAQVFMALALGARAVLIGRPQVYALAVAGDAGVARMLRILRDELELTMALAGCATLADITADSLLSLASAGMDA
ncbi:MAG: alpha-hydroxy-acid oxidizing protein [Pseudomonadales bacterium]|nr:alpha-hydroxy-acid oxidizing protein [Pseudomonadales bacterium]